MAEYPATVGKGTEVAEGTVPLLPGGVRTCAVLCEESIVGLHADIEPSTARWIPPQIVEFHFIRTREYQA